MRPGAAAQAWFVTGLGAIATVAVLAAIGVSVPALGVVSIAIALGVLLLGATVYDPTALPMLAMPASVAVMRIGGDTTNLSVSDLVLFVAFWPAVLLGPRPYTRALRSMLWISAVYQFATLFTVLVNPYAANVVEWFHEWLTIAGALVVGWVVGRSGRARPGIALYLAMCVLIAVATCIVGAAQLARGSLAPVFVYWPTFLHKNFIGDVLGIAALVVYARPPWLGISRRVAWSLLGLFALAIAASQSRQAIVGFGVAAVVIALRRGQGTRHSRLILIGLVPAVYFVVRVLRDQLASNNQFNSAYQRLTWFGQSLEVWRQDPLFGIGLRWWYTDRAPFRFQPPNAIFEMLSSAGIVGTAGFVILSVASLVVLWRVDPRFGTLAFAAVASRLVQGQLDLYWVSIQTTVPFILAGVCLGAQAWESARPPDAHGLPRDPSARARPSEVPA